MIRQSLAELNHAISVRVMNGNRLVGAPRVATVVVDVRHAALECSELSLVDSAICGANGGRLAGS